MPYCLIPNLAQKMLEALKNGKINPKSLAKMSSKERHDFFSKIIGENDARNINALFESKLLLKNQKAGMITWAKTITGIKETTRRDIISKIERLNKVLDAKSERTFLEDLASKRLGIGISFKEAQIITELSDAFSKAKKGVAEGADAYNVGYGAKKVALQKYTQMLKLQAETMSLGEFIKNPLKVAEFIAGNLKSIKSSLDNSAIFRQGWRAMFTNPIIWANDAVKSFINIGKVLKGNENVLDATKSEIYNRKNSINRYYERAKLEIGTGEEAYPTSLPAKIPLLGKLFRASEVAYEGFLMRLRADIFDKLVKMQEETQKAKLSDLDLRSLGRLVNSLTGRGSLGAFEKVGKQVNVIFFSPKNLVSHVQTLTLHFGQEMSSFARKQAALNLVKIVGGVSVILVMAKMLNKDSVEEDSRSSDFGKIRIGDTRFDMTGGMGSLVVLATRLIRQSSKSSTSGIISHFNQGYGSQDVSGVLTNFFENKLAPATSLIKDLVKQQDFLGNKPTIKGEITNALAPMSVANAYELLKNPNSANAVLGIIADGLGISTNTYSYQANWQTNQGAELKQFERKVGSEKLKEANQKYNNQVNDYIVKIRQDKGFLNKTDEEKQKQLTLEKDRLKQRIFREYGFKYRKKKQ